MKIESSIQVNPTPSQNLKCDVCVNYSGVQGHAESSILTTTATAAAAAAATTTTVTTTTAIAWLSLRL